MIFDVDGVLADFVMGFTKTAGVPKPWGTLTNTAKWSFKDVMAPELVNATWEKVKDDPYWWVKLPALVSREVFWKIDRLQRGNHVLFVTARVSYCNAQAQTAAWLRVHGVDNPNVIVTPKKGEIANAVGADYHIDDKPENVACVHWMADKCRSYFLENQQSKGQWLPERVRRVPTVSEFINDIQEGR